MLSTEFVIFDSHVTLSGSLFSDSNLTRTLACRSANILPDINCIGLKQLFIQRVFIKLLIEFINECLADHLGLVSKF